MVITFVKMDHVHYKFLNFWKIHPQIPSSENNHKADNIACSSHKPQLCGIVEGKCLCYCRHLLSRKTCFPPSPIFYPDILLRHMLLFCIWKSLGQSKRYLTARRSALMWFLWWRRMGTQNMTEIQVSHCRVLATRRSHRPHSPSEAHFGFSHYILGLNFAILSNGSKVVEALIYH